MEKTFQPAHLISKFPWIMSTLTVPPETTPKKSRSSEKLHAVKKALSSSDGQKRRAALNTLEVTINGMRPIVNEIPVPGFSIVTELLLKVIEAVKVGERYRSS